MAVSDDIHIGTNLVMENHSITKVNTISSPDPAIGANMSLQKKNTIKGIKIDRENDDDEVVNANCIRNKLGISGGRLPRSTLKSSNYVTSSGGVQQTRYWWTTITDAYMLTESYGTIVQGITIGSKKARGLSYNRLWLPGLSFRNILQEK